MSANTLESTLTISCRCGQFGASVSIDKQDLPTRLMCYCVDCQTYARHLNQEEVQLDDQGGTDILQISPAQFSITTGGEHLGNLMLSPKGIYRWHTTCCQTPICNTTSKAAMPYAALLTNNITSIADDNNKNRASLLNDAVGPVAYGVGAGEKHPMSADWPISKGFGFQGIFGTLKKMLTWRLRGDHKRSIFIDSVSGKPLVVPTLLTREQRQTARNKV